MGIAGSPKRHSNDTAATQAGLFFSASALARCRELSEEIDYQGALKRLQIMGDTLQIGDLDLRSSDVELRRFAESKAIECRQAVQYWPNNPALAYARMKRIAEKYQLTVPGIDSDGIQTIIVQLTAMYWWLRQFRRLQRRVLDAVYRDIGLVQKHRAAYCGDHALALYQSQQQRNALYLEQTFLTNEDDEEISLAEISSHTIANPTIRRAELMARIRGFETVADIAGHQGVFYTLTTPSRFHAFSSRGYHNKAHNGLTPRDAQDWLCNTWELIRAKLHRDNIRPYGFRVAEPHHDGTPHWHF